MLSQRLPVLSFLGEINYILKYLYQTDAVN
jgi:hypothetical protein